MTMNRDKLTAALAAAHDGAISFGETTDEHAERLPILATVNGTKYEFEFFTLLGPNETGKHSVTVYSYTEDNGRGESVLSINPAAGWPEVFGDPAWNRLK